MKRITFYLFFALVLTFPAWGQGSSSLINVCTGNGPPGPCAQSPVGSGATGSVPVPVSSAPTASSSFGIAPVVSGSASSGVVLKATPGNLYGVYAECTSACWLMVFNAVAVPSNGSTTAGIASGNLQDCIDIAAGSSRSLAYPGPPEVFSVGMSAAISSTACGTLTLSTVGFIHGMVQ